MQICYYFSLRNNASVIQSFLTFHHYMRQFLSLCEKFLMFHNLYLFHKKVFTQLLKVSCIFPCNHQATGLKKYEFTTIVLKTTNPYLLDRVEFKHQFVKFKAGHDIYIKKEYYNPLHHLLVERGVCQGLTIPRVLLGHNSKMTGPGKKGTK